MLSDNIIDIFLEVCLFSYIIALSKFDADSTWSEADITIYIVFLFVAVSAYVVFSIGKFVYKLLTRSAKISKTMKKENDMNKQTNSETSQRDNDLDNGYYEQDQQINNLPSEEIEEIKVDDQSVFIGHPDQANENINQSINSMSLSLGNQAELNNCQMNGDNDDVNPQSINSIQLNFDEEDP